MTFVYDFLGCREYKLKKEQHKMKRTILAVFAILFLFAPVMKAQNTTSDSSVIYPQQLEYDNHTRFLTGFEGGNSFGNMFFSATAGAEIPLAKRFEIDINDSFSPLESHIALGHGWANVASGGGIVWIAKSKSLGLNGSVDYSNYSTQIAKGGYYVHSGLTWRTYAWGSPARFTFDYFRQFNNGIACGDIAGCSKPGANGTETDHVQGGEFGFAVRLGSTGPANVRLTFSTSVGHVLTQGNQACDGSLGVFIPSCKRGSTVSGGATMGLVFEFPRHRGYENNLF
jgi:hypothetical protein